MAALLAVFATASAQEARDYGSRPIRLVVPVPAGGGTDIVARIVAAGLQESAGLRMVIDNRGGAGGVIGSETVARAVPDGYTLLFAYAAFTTTPFISKVPYDPYSDFTPVTCWRSTAPGRRESVAARQQREGAHRARKIEAEGDQRRHRKRRQRGPSGAGAVQAAHGHHRRHRAGDLQGRRAHGDRARGRRSAGDVREHAHVMGHIKAGKAKVLATIGSKRLASFPDPPTLTELGVKGVDAAAPWQGILGPAKMPRPIVMRLYSESAKF